MEPEAPCSLMLFSNANGAFEGLYDGSIWYACTATVPAMSRRVMRAMDVRIFLNIV